MRNFDMDVRSSNRFLRSVFMNMFLGILISFGVALYMYSNPFLLKNISRFFSLIVLAQLAMVFSLNLGINKISTGTARLLFLAYSAVNGITLSTIGFIYEPMVVLYAFITALVVFAVMAAFGFMTNEDLSSYGKFLTIGLVSLIIMGIINIFLGIQAIYWATTLLGVVLFCGLTAYDVNRIKMLAYNAAYGNEEVLAKIGIIGALQLYLDFINLFLYILRFFGRKNSR